MIQKDYWRFWAITVNAMSSADETVTEAELVVLSDGEGVVTVVDVVDSVNPFSLIKFLNHLTESFTDLGRAGSLKST